MVRSKGVKSNTGSVITIEVQRHDTQSKHQDPETCVHTLPGKSDTVVVSLSRPGCVWVDGCMQDEARGGFEIRTGPIKLARQPAAV